VDGKLGTFLLGVIAAVVLIMLWKKEQPMFSLPGATPPAPTPGPGGCGSGACGGGGSATMPSVQAMLAATGLDGQISPGTPPLNAVTGGQGGTSFYTAAGNTPDVSFTFTPVVRNPVIGSPAQPRTGINVPGSPTTPATVTPTRATQPVPNYAETGFVNRFNIVGIPRTVLSTGRLN
jgi:hypothetical protein